MRPRRFPWIFCANEGTSTWLTPATISYFSAKDSLQRSWILASKSTCRMTGLNRTLPDSFQQKTTSLSDSQIVQYQCYTCYTPQNTRIFHGESCLQLASIFIFQASNLQFLTHLCLASASACAEGMVMMQPLARVHLGLEAERKEMDTSRGWCLTLWKPIRFCILKSLAWNFLVFFVCFVVFLTLKSIKNSTYHPQTKGSKLLKSCSLSKLLQESFSTSPEKSWINHLI